MFERYDFIAANDSCDDVLHEYPFIIEAENFNAPAKELIKLIKSTNISDLANRKILLDKIISTDKIMSKRISSFIWNFKH